MMEKMEKISWKKKERRSKGKVKKEILHARAIVENKQASLMEQFIRDYKSGKIEHPKTEKPFEHFLTGKYVEIDPYNDEGIDDRVPVKLENKVFEGEIVVEYHIEHRRCYGVWLDIAIPTYRDQRVWIRHPLGYRSILAPRYTFTEGSNTEQQLVMAAREKAKDMAPKKMSRVAGLLLIERFRKDLEDWKVSRTKVNEWQFREVRDINPHKTKKAPVRITSPIVAKIQSDIEKYKKDKAIMDEFLSQLTETE